MPSISNGSLPQTPEQEKFLRHHFETLTDAPPEGRALPLSEPRLGGPSELGTVWASLGRASLAGLVSVVGGDPCSLRTERQFPLPAPFAPEVCVVSGDGLSEELPARAQGWLAGGILRAPSASAPRALPRIPEGRAGL